MKRSLALGTLTLRTVLEADTPRARAVFLVDGQPHIYLSNGATIVVPVERFRRLREASPEQLADWRLIGDGEGVRWPSIDEDLAIEPLLEESHGPVRYTVRLETGHRDVAPRVRRRTLTVA